MTLPLRRDAGTAAALLAPTPGHDLGPRRSVPHRCVVVGAGSVGRRHLRNLTALGVDCVALRSHQGQAGALVGWKTVTTWDAVEAARPTVAIIANPTALHVEAALRATRLGCDLLVEKPLADSLASATRLANAVAVRGTVVLVGYQFRYHPTLQRVREWIAEGIIGTPVSAQAHWGEYLPGWHPGEDHLVGYSARGDLGGGVVRTLSHPVDYVRWLLGEVVTVSAMTARRTGVTVDVEDVAALTLRLANDAVVTVTLDYVERPARHTLHVVGSEGSLSWNAASGVAVAWHAASGRQLRADPEPGFERNTMFVDELRHLLACVEGREQPRCTLADGVRSMAIADAAHRSALERREIDV